MKYFRFVTLLILVVLTLVVAFQPRPIGRHLAGDFDQQLISGIHDVIKDVIHPQHLLSGWRS